MRDDLSSSAGSGVYTPFSKNVDKFVEQLKSKNPIKQGRSRAPSPSMQDWKVIPGNSGTFQGTPHQEMSLLRSDAYRSPSPSVNGYDTNLSLEWQDAKRRHSAHLTQLMCEGCSFCVSVASDEEKALTQLNRRFENRCPMTLFSQMAGIGAGAVRRSNAYKFLEQRGWRSEEITELLDHLDLQGTGEIDREHLVRSYDAVMCEDPGNRNIPDAIAMTFQTRRFAFQYQGSVVQPKDAPSPDRWHEQACCHLGLKGFVRLCRVGLLLEVGISLQGQRDDIRAFVDAFMVSSVSGNTDSMVLPIRRLGKEEIRMAELKVTMHHSSKELHLLHKADLARSNAPVGPLEMLLRAEAEEEEVAEPHVQSPHLADVVPSSMHSSAAARAILDPHTLLSRAKSTEPGSAPHMPREDAAMASYATSPAKTPGKDQERYGSNESARNGVPSPPVQRVLSTSVEPATPPPSLSLPQSQPTVTSETPNVTAQAATVSLAQGSLSPPGRRAAALYDYEAAEEDELSIYSGQVLQVVSRHDDGWVLVQNSHGSFGVVPGNYLAAMDPEPALNGRAITVAKAHQGGGDSRQLQRGEGGGGGGGEREGFSDALTAGASAGSDFEARLQELEGLLGPAGSGSGSGPDLASAVSACRKTVAATLAALAQSRDHPRAASPDPPRPGPAVHISPTSEPPRYPAPVAPHQRAVPPAAASDRGGSSAPRVTGKTELSKRASSNTVTGSEPGGGAGAAVVYEQRAREGFLNDFDESSESESSEESDGWRPRSRLSRLGMHNRDRDTGPATTSSSRGGAMPAGSSDKRTPASQARPGPVVRSRRLGGDLSDDSDSDDDDSSDGRLLLQASPPEVPKLNLSKVGSSRLTPQQQRPPMPVAGHGGGVGVEKFWRVYVQLIEARDLSALEGGFGRGDAPSAFCCLSILQGAGGAGSSRLPALVDHDVGLTSVAPRGGVRLSPQQTTRPARHSFAPAWNQGFVFADAYPAVRPDNLKGGGPAGRVLGVGERESLGGGEVLLLLTLHDAGDTPGIGGTLLGRAALPVAVGHPADHWVPVRPREGSALGRGNPAVHLRVAYGSSSFGSSPSTAMGPNSGFWA